MSVIVIGDRKVGKTNMVVALAEGTENVNIIDSGSLNKRFNVDTGVIAGTSRKEEDMLSIRVNLPAGEREFQTNWIDTPGEVWDNPSWREENPTAWQDIQQSVSNSRAIFLLLPPYRTMIIPEQLDGEPANDPDTMPRPEQWRNNLSAWLKFFRQTAPRVQHILISIHKADLFCNLNREERKWRYDPSREPKWVTYNEHIQRTYFELAAPIIRQHNRQSAITPRFFITTTKNPALLELPWIYLGAYLANV